MSCLLATWELTVAALKSSNITLYNSLFNSHKSYSCLNYYYHSIKHFFFSIEMCKQVQMQKKGFNFNAQTEIQTNKQKSKKQHYAMCSSILFNIFFSLLFHLFIIVFYVHKIRKTKYFHTLNRINFFRFTKFMNLQKNKKKRIIII